VRNEKSNQRRFDVDLVVDKWSISVRRSTCICARNRRTVDVDVHDERSTENSTNRITCARSNLFLVTLVVGYKAILMICIKREKNWNLKGDLNPASLISLSVPLTTTPLNASCETSILERTSHTLHPEQCDA
jgi:hypothetical protein